MAVAVTGATEAPAEAAEQEDHEYDDENEPERHETSLPLPALKQSDWRNLYSLATEDRSSVVVLRVPLLLSNGQGAQAFAVQREEAQMKGIALL
jgi:hypothetical protein